ncbi:CBS/transporter associated domain protein [Cystobacter fuscus DSM 2262]|uniref:CBS/transporter associated domain protein n=1 Tax=Cystobacter fuscus (strain ATCC 25194 / DSM 2262 / NBRC 100088 / M29) TaxID=1242864 RepID=S9PQL7_CYSF2|nr:hemolysin family protein [Cystobacter fuscus]EPX64797.1 CBS/transporter associated domain protein [Cystobacter fuscus DSM 2262]
MPTWVLWTACLALVFLRGFIAAAESALYGTSDLKAQELATSHPSAGGRILRHKTERESTATALRVGMVLSGFLAAAIGSFVPPQMLNFTRLGESPWLNVATVLAGALLVGLLATLVEVTMRGLANAGPERWALRLSWLVSLLVVLFYPPMRLLMAPINLVARGFGRTLRFEPPPPPLEELEKLLAAQAAKEEVDQSAPQLIRSIFELSDKRCRDVMVPRTEVVCVDLSTPSVEVLRLLAEENHSRIPVYRDDVDHIMGVLHARDLIPLLQHPELIVLQDTIRPANFVPWLKPIGDLLREMQRQKIHMAIVVDEYGGFMGIVTLEDILREIVGDIGDEFEVEEKQVEKLADGAFLVDAAMEVDGFTQAFGFPLPEGDFDTLGGFLSSLAGHLPDVGERFTYDGWAFTVQAKEGARIDRIRMVKLKQPVKEATHRETPGEPPAGEPPGPRESASANHKG